MRDTDPGPIVDPPRTAASNPEPGSSIDPGIPRPLPFRLPTANASDARRLLLAAVLLGILADPLLRNGLWGVGILVWMLLLAVLVVTVAQQAARPLSGESVGWLAIALLSAAALSWRDADLLKGFDFLAMLAALVLLALSIGGAPVTGLAAARVRDLLRAAFGTGVEVATGIIPLLLRDTGFHSSLRTSSHERARQIGRALLITTPLVLVFTLLLARADPLFGSYFRFLDFDLQVVLSHVLIAGFFTWVVAGWLRRSFGNGSRVGVPHSTPFPLALRDADVTIALGALNILFGAFIVVQLGWLFGGEALVLRTTGLSYAEYARSGFFELMWVAGLLLTVILIAHALIPRSAARTLHIYRLLALSLALLLGLILLSAAARMRLYVQYYGISTERIYATAFMIWVALVFVWLALTVLRSRPRTFAAGLVVSGYLVLFTLNLVNPDALVARSNLARGARTAAGSSGTDLQYLASLGGDAVPVLVAALVAPAIPVDSTTVEERCGASRILFDRWSGARDEQSTRSWTQWNLARTRATRAVLVNEAALQTLACPTAAQQARPPISLTPSPSAPTTAPT